MQMPDVSTLSKLTVPDVLEDRKCDATTGKHPTNWWPCRAECDLGKYFDVDTDKQEAYLKTNSTEAVGECPEGFTRTNRRGVTKDLSGRRLRICAVWFKVMQCAYTPDARRQWEGRRNKWLQYRVRDEIKYQYLADFSRPEFGLRARMAFFWMNFYATQNSLVNDYLMMYRQYYNL